MPRRWTVIARMRFFTHLCLKICRISTKGWTLCLEKSFKYTIWNVLCKYHKFIILIYNNSIYKKFISDISSPLFHYLVLLCNIILRIWGSQYKTVSIQYSEESHSDRIEQVQRLRSTFKGKKEKDNFNNDRHCIML